MRLHHMGFVAAEITTAMPAFTRSMAAEWDGQIFEDPLQKAKVAFMTTSALVMRRSNWCSRWREFAGAEVFAAGRRDASPVL